MSQHSQGYAAFDSDATPFLLGCMISLNVSASPARWTHEITRSIGSATTWCLSTKSPQNAPPYHVSEAIANRIASVACPPGPRKRGLPNLRNQILQLDCTSTREKNVHEGGYVRGRGG